LYVHFLTQNGLTTEWSRMEFQLVSIVHLLFPSTKIKKLSKPQKIGFFTL